MSTSMRETPTLERVLNDIKHLREAKKLLEDLLWYYDSGKEEFIFPSQKEWELKLKRLSPDNQRRAVHPRDKFHERINNLLWEKEEYDN